MIGRQMVECLGNIRMCGIVERAVALLQEMSLRMNFDVSKAHTHEVESLFQLPVDKI